MFVLKSTYQKALDRIKEVEGESYYTAWMQSRDDVHKLNKALDITEAENVKLHDQVRSVLPDAHCTRCDVLKGRMYSLQSEYNGLMMDRNLQQTMADQHRKSYQEIKQRLAGSGYEELRQMRAKIASLQLELSIEKASKAVFGTVGASNEQFNNAELRTIRSLCHPDKHGNRKAANEITSKLNEMV